MLRFLRSNLGYLIWGVFYFLIAWASLEIYFGDKWKALLWTGCLYGASITIALSAIGEILLRWYLNLSRIQTQQERDYLMPLFDEVYEKAKERFPRINKNVTLFIDNSMTVNAFAVGKSTIAVTRGAINTFSEDELVGVLAHEFGHLVHGDTKALLLNIIGNGFFTVCVLALRVVLFFVRFVTALFDESGVINLVMWIFDFFINIYIMIIMLIGQLILSATSRKAEYFADSFSHDIGLSTELIQALYILQRISVPSNIPIMERLRASHPNMGKRIARLERLQELSA